MAKRKLIGVLTANPEGNISAAHNGRPARTVPPL